jgi:hypothetical protein
MSDARTHQTAQEYADSCRAEWVEFAKHCGLDDWAARFASCASERQPVNALIVCTMLAREREQKLLERLEQMARTMEGGPHANREFDSAPPA